MTFLRRRRRFSAAVIVALVVCGVAAGLVLARNGSAVSKFPPGVLARGQFRSITWSTKGTASIVRDASGHLTLRLSGDFNTRRGPDLWVYLERYQGSYEQGKLHGKLLQWKDLGALHRSWGSQSYRLPASATSQIGASVAIFCGECGQVSGLARLTRVT
jgi:hypothetical protein